MKPKNKSHDKFFRAYMGNLQIAQGFFRSRLPQAILPYVDLTTLEVTKESYVEPTLKEYITDILYKVRIKDQDGYIYLLAEHQRRPEKLMPFRLLKYQVQIMDYHVYQLKNKKLPLVVPIVCYNGTKPYPYTTDILECFDQPAEVVANIWMKPFKLLDLARMSDDELRTKEWYSVIECLLKHVKRRDFLNELHLVRMQLQEMLLQGSDNLVVTLLEYALNHVDVSMQQLMYVVTDGLPEQDEEQIMVSLADRLRQEGWQAGLREGRSLAARLHKRSLQKGWKKGRQEGRQEGRTEIALQLTQQNFSPEFISQVTGFSLSELQSLAESCEV